MHKLTLLKYENLNCHVAYSRFFQGRFVVHRLGIAAVNMLKGNAKCGNQGVLGVDCGVVYGSIGLAVFSARCNIHISHLCHDASPSVRLSVM